ncbi:hypothetical protein FRZ03_21620 [Streptomyces misionensis]|uniref:Uncharacterized protein n=1 Tax=Streptomyces misionensis TaxID=67331 RepID=A0A5C6JIK3_9ACTN|nr:hypothetical protein FRZ03_21620 [Streptomyces misionensis]
MPRRIMFVRLKAGHDTDRGPSWIGWVDFSKTWRIAARQGEGLGAGPAPGRTARAAPSWWAAVGGFPVRGPAPARAAGG